MRVGSDYANYWARRLRLYDVSAKAVLMAIANYVDEEGKAWPSVGSLAADTDQSDATVRRRLHDLEAFGCIARFPMWVDDNGHRNKEARGRRSSDDIKLLFNVTQEHIDRIVEERKGRRPEAAADTPSDASAEGGDTEGTPVNLQGVPLQSGSAKLQGAPVNLEGSDPVKLQGGPLQWCKGYMNPSLEEEAYPQSPLPSPEPAETTATEAPGASASGQQEGSAREDFERAVDDAYRRFANVYPIPIEDPELVRQLLSAMSEAERDIAIRAGEGYAIFVRKYDRKPKGAANFLRKQQAFAEYARLAPPPPPPKCFVARGSEEWRARAVLRAVRDRAMPATGMFEGREGAWLDGTPLPREALTLAAYAGDDMAAARQSWLVVEDRSREFGAWRERIRKWTGEELEAGKIILDGMVTLSTGSRTMDVPRSTIGVRVPQRWPPTKADGRGEPTGGEGLEEFEAGIGDTRWGGT